MKDKVKGSLCLLIATVIWGSTFVAQSVGLDHIGPFTFQAARCFLAVLILLPVIALLDKRNKRSFRKQWNNPKLWISGIVCGAVVFVAGGLQQVGLVYTTPGKAGFITAMYIVIVPILGLLLKRRPSPLALVSVVIAVAGLYCLSCVGVSDVNVGDILLLGCAAAFAVQITIIDRFVQHIDGFRFNCIQSLVCSLLSGVMMFVTETPQLEAITACWLPLCYAGILSMGIAFSLQIIGQKHLEPTLASLIMSLESVFAVLTGWLILGQWLTFWEGVGCALVFSSVILSQIPIKSKKKAPC